ncbi:hypothetical protein [Nonomuraea terrae]|uniref:hypothetical protein n=1 Tax=Nonomuraea terrae TaxID=2530383 RepID=UPI003CCC669B
MRARRSGTLLYVGSTSSVMVPPFFGPYVASKAASTSWRRSPGTRSAGSASRRPS